MPEARLGHEARVKLVPDVSGVGVWSWDANTYKITADTAYRQLYGFSADADLNSVTWQERLHPDDRDALRAIATATDGLAFSAACRRATTRLSLSFSR